MTSLLNVKIETSRINNRIHKSHLLGRIESLNGIQFVFLVSVDHFNPTLTAFSYANHANDMTDGFASSVGIYVLPSKAI